MKHFFDDKATEWDNDPKKVERARTFAEEIIKIIPIHKKLTALEFGCGTGLLSFFLKNVFHQITLVDNSAGMIEVLREKIDAQKIKNFTPSQIDLLNVEQLGLPSKHDVLYTLMTLHHIHDLDKIISIFKQILLPGGYLCIADLEKEDGSFHAEHPDFDGHNGFNKEELSSLLQTHGFEVVSYSVPLTLEKPVKNRIKTFPLFLLVAKS